MSDGNSKWLKVVASNVYETHTVNSPIKPPPPNKGIPDFPDPLWVECPLQPGCTTFGLVITLSGFIREFTVYNLFYGTCKLQILNPSWAYPDIT